MKKVAFLILWVFVISMPEPFWGEGAMPIGTSPANAEELKNIFPQKNALLQLISEVSTSHEMFLTSDWGKRNPFNTSSLEVKPPVQAKPEPSKPPVKLPRLEGILMSQPKPSAIINNTVVGIGSDIAGFKVLSITANEVVLTDGTENLSLKIDSKFSIPPDKAPAK